MNHAFQAEKPAGLRRTRLPAPLDTLRLPLMQAPMSIASTATLAAAACRAGIVGCFPAHNAALDAGLGPWIAQVHRAIDEERDAGGRPGPLAVNIKLSRRKPPELLAREIAACRAERVRVVTTNVGDPTDIVKQVHDWGGIVIHDATTLAHAERAAAAGVDGIMLVCAGAGGLGGLLNPFAFTRRVRRFFGGILQLAGGIADGAGIAAALALGADMVCMGTRFIATRESGVAEGHKRMLVEADLPDVLWTDAICGIAANFLRPSICANGLDPDRLPPLGPDGHPALPDGVKAWRTVWSGGHSTAGVNDIPTVSELVERLRDEFEQARRA